MVLQLILVAKKLGTCKEMIYSLLVEKDSAATTRLRRPYSEPTSRVRDVVAQHVGPIIAPGTPVSAIEH